MGLSRSGFSLARLMPRGKKAIFFTIIAVSLLAIALFSYSLTYSYTLQEQASVIEARVDSMNRFLKEVDSDMENAVYISGFRALISLEDHVGMTGDFVDSTSAAFEELFINGTLDGEDAFLMGNNTFTYWLGRIGDQAAATGVNLSVELESVNISHIDPWTVRVSVSATVNLSDSKSTAQWISYKAVFADILIIGFEDPWYTAYTNNNILRRINQTLYEGNYTNLVTNTTNIRDHVDKTFYTNFTGAPSFLMRFENNFNASEFGIESLVDKSVISAYHSCPAETSSVDNIYWRCDNSIVVRQVADWSGFRIDNRTAGGVPPARIDKYMLEDYLI